MNFGLDERFQTEFFAKKSGYQCVAYDNRGCGRSSSPLTFNYSTNQMAKDALALIDHLKWSKCHVVGISMGGMIALEFSLLASERILSLTLIATHAGGFAGRAPFVGVFHILRSFVSRDEKTLIENAMNMLYGAKTLADAQKRQVEERKLDEEKTFFFFDFEDFLRLSRRTISSTPAAVVDRSSWTNPRRSTPLRQLC